MTVVKELSDYRRTLTEGAFFQRQNPDIVKCTFTCNMENAHI